MQVSLNFSKFVFIFPQHTSMISIAMPVRYSETGCDPLTEHEVRVAGPSPQLLKGPLFQQHVQQHVQAATRMVKQHSQLPTSAAARMLAEVARVLDPSSGRDTFAICSL